MSLIAYFYVFHIILVHSHHYCFLMTLFHKSHICFIFLECWWLCDFQIFMDIFLFYSLLEWFLLVFKFSIKLVVYFLILEEFSIMLNYFQTYFWKPLPSMGDWMGDHALYAQIENYFNMCMNRVIFMSYTLDPHCVFQLVSQLISILYTHICFYICMLQLQIVSILIGI